MKLLTKALTFSLLLALIAPSATHASVSETIEEMTPETTVSVFSDQDQIAEWSEIQISALVEAGVLTGYPDGTFGPNNTLTRAEFSVALYNAILRMAEYVDASQSDQAEYMYEQLNQLRMEVDLLTAEQELVNIASVDDALNTNDNYVGLGISYAVDKAPGTSAVITLGGKYQIVELSSKLALSARGFVDTDTVLGLATTLDYDVTNKLEIYAGAGAAYMLEKNNYSPLTGDTSSGIAPYALVGGSYDVSDNALVFVDGKVPLTVSDNETAQVTAGVGFKF